MHIGFILPWETGGAGVAVAESDLGVLYSWLNRSWTFALQIQDAFKINGGKMTSIKGHIYLSF